MSDTPAPVSNLSLPGLEAISGTLRSVFINLGFFAAMLLLIPAVASQFSRNAVVIEPIAVPQALDRQADAAIRLSRAIDLDPYKAAPIFSRGTSLALTGNNAAARADFQRVLELDTTGTGYAEMATNFIDILDGLDAAAADEPAATEPPNPKLVSPDGPRLGATP